MPFDRFIIGPVGGQQTNLKPYLIPDQAFESLTNAYVFRGRVRKRFGSYLMNGSVDNDVAQLYSRLRVQVGTTAVSTGNLTSTTMPGSVFAKGQMFSVGNTIFTAYQTSGATYTTGAATATYNTGTGALVITGNNENPSTPVYFYPSTPVMGLISYETNVINDEPVYAFDTQFAYLYSGGSTGAWSRLGSYTWTGDDSQFFWGCNYRGVQDSTQYLFITNDNYVDGITYWNGSTWTEMNPIISPTTRVYTSRIIIPFKYYLLMLNVTEAIEGIQVGNSNTNSSTGNLSSTAVTLPSTNAIFAVGQNFTVGSSIFTITTVATGSHALATNSASTAALNISSNTPGSAAANLTITGNNINQNLPVYYMPGYDGATAVYPNRVRWCWAGDPTDVSAWQGNVAGSGGFQDADTTEQIITCQYVKDHLIVYFERSTYELVYTGNSVQPIIWQKLNTELGAESTFSIIPFDKVAVGIANVGIHACNGSNVERIDQNIPDEVFGVSNDNNGVYRVYGIRDYYTEMLYWSFPSTDANGVYPNRVLVYNYKTGTWAFNDDSITSFGYFQDQLDATWQSTNDTWQEAEYTWGDAVIQNKFRNIIAGNQQGYVFIIDADESRNAPALQITKFILSDNIVTITSYNHNLVSDDFVAFENLNGITGIAFPNNIFEVTWIDANTISIVIEPSVSGTYTGGGTMARVSQIDILTKQYNFYMDVGQNAYIQKIDMLFDKTVDGEITVDTYVSSTTLSTIESGMATGAIMGTGIVQTSPYALVPLEAIQDRVWHPVYPQAEGECVQLHIYLSPTELLNADIAWEDFELHQLIFYASATSRLQ